ncbi:hypothetical protein [Ruegeria atlantica]|uniref:hypothetical protein n=1 Tax=Ruegeria atlantica TaxID=81569 RepID=UPI002494397A|nr:hypothetical protein [Ruegeria atlantica]
MNKPFELLSMDREHWQQRLTGLEKHLGYKHGFKLLFSPWRLLGTAHTLFLSLNLSDVRDFGTDGRLI